MSTNVATLVAELTADASGAKKGAAEGATALDGWVKAQKETAKAAEELRGAIKKSMAAETVTASAANLSGILKGLGSDFASLAGDAIGGFAHIAQGLAQGGLLGGAISGLTFTIGTIAQAWGEAERAALAARDVQLDAIAKLSEEAGKWTEQLVATNNELRVMQGLKPGANIAAAMAGMDENQATLRANTARGSLATLAQQLTQAQGKLRRTGGSDARMSGSLSEDEMSMGLPSESADELRSSIKALGLQMAETEKEIEAAEAQAKTAAEKAKVAKTKGGLATGASSGAALDPAVFMGPVFQTGISQAIAQQAAAMSSFGKGSLGGSLGGDEYLRKAREDAAAFADHALEVDASAKAWHAHAQGLADAEKAQRDATIASMDLAESLDGIGTSFGDSGMGKLFDALARGEGEFDLQGGAGYHAGQAALGAAQSTGGAIGMIAGAAAGGPAGIAAAAVSLLGESKTVQYIQKQLGKMLSTVGEALGDLLRPLAPFVTVIAKTVEGFAAVLAPLSMFSALEPVFRILFDGVKLVGGVIAAVGAGMKWITTEIYNSLYGALATVLETLDSYIGIIPDGWAEALRASITTQGGLTETMTAAFDAVNNLSWDEIQDEIDGVSAALGQLNAPAFYKVANAVMGADAGRYVSGTGQDTQAMTNGAPTRGTVHPGMVSMAGGGITINGPITVIANDPRAFIEAMRRISMMSSGTPVFP